MEASNPTAGDDYEGMEAQEEFGVYIGPATQDEVIADIAAHHDVFLLYMHAVDRSLVWFKTARLYVDDDHLDDEDDRDVMVVFAQPEGLTAGNPLVYVDAPLVLSFSKASHYADTFVAERWSGGVRIHLGFGNAHHTLTVVFWHSFGFKTADGDVAPGFGGFAADISEVTDDPQT